MLCPVSWIPVHTCALCVYWQSPADRGHDPSGYSCQHQHGLKHKGSGFSHFIPLPSTCQINGLVQDCSNSSALAMELLKSCTKPSKPNIPFHNKQVIFCLTPHFCNFLHQYLSLSMVTHQTKQKTEYTDGLVQDCGNFTANTQELPQLCSKPSKLLHDHPILSGLTYQWRRGWCSPCRWLCVLHTQPAQPPCQPWIWRPEKFCHKKS